MCVCVQTLLGCIILSNDISDCFLCARNLILTPPYDVGTAIISIL